MQMGANLTGYDFLVMGLLLLLISRGLWLGFLKQVIGLVALYFGYIVASQYHDRLFPFLRDFSGNPKVIFFSSYALVFIGTYILAMFLGKGLNYVIKITMVGWFDRLLGGFLGLAKGVLLIILMHMILGTVLAPENQLLRSCETCDELNAATGLALELVRNEEARKALMQQVPAISVEAVKGYLDPTGKVLAEIPAKKPETTSAVPLQNAPETSSPSSPRSKNHSNSFWDDASSPETTPSSQSSQ